MVARHDNGNCARGSAEVHMGADGIKFPVGSIDKDTCQCILDLFAPGRPRGDFMLWSLS